MVTYGIENVRGHITEIIPEKKQITNTYGILFRNIEYKVAIHRCPGLRKSTSLEKIIDESHLKIDGEYYKISNRDKKINEIVWNLE